MPKPNEPEKVYQFIKGFIHEYGFSPSLREIAAATRLSLPLVNECLAWLEGEGRIRRRAATARGIALLDQDKN